MSDNVIQISQYKKSLTANVVNDFIEEAVGYYKDTIYKFNIDTQNLDIAFDIATIQFLLRGMAHRSQGQEHPSQILLNALRDKMLP